MAEILDPAFAPPTVAPFPVGTSPFRQKGNGYLGDLRYYDAVVRGGCKAVIAAIPDLATRNFFGQTFKPSEWYDAYPGATLEVAAARVRGVSFEQHRRQTGLWHAEEAVKGVYATLLRLVSSESIALWGPRISSLYFEFGKTETRASGPREVQGIRRGVPRELAQWVTFASVEFSIGVLRLSGARNAHVSIQQVEPDGREYGRDLVRIHCVLRWD